MFFDFADLDGDVDHSSDFRAGDSVTAQWMSGGWYPAVVDRANGDGSYEISWADGACEGRTKLPGQLRRLRRQHHSSPLRPGDRVEGLYLDGEWYPATIVLDHGDETYQIEWGLHRKTLDPRRKTLEMLRPLDRSPRDAKAPPESLAPEDDPATGARPGEPLAPEADGRALARRAADTGREERQDWWWWCWWRWAWKCSWSPLSCRGFAAAPRAAAARLSLAAARGAGARRAAAACAAALGKPLAFEVREGPVEICEEPSLDARVVGLLAKGEVVSGYPGGSWLELPNGFGRSRWVLQHGEALGYGPEPRLAPRWAVPLALAEASGLRLEWPGVSCAGVAYSVEWRRACDDCPGAAACRVCWGRVREGLASCGEPRTVLCCLGLGSRLQVRVEARLAGARAGESDVRLPGSWSAVGAK